MRPEPALTPDAHADVLYAAEHYEAQRANLGLDFLDEFERTTSMIREAPLLSTLVDPPVRRALLQRFPYATSNGESLVAAAKRGFDAERGPLRWTRSELWRNSCH
jgi:hypothetical protein